MEHFNLGKSANQIWKESGTTLSFKDWLQREKDKGVFLPNKKLMEFNDANGESELSDNQKIIQETLKNKKQENKKDNTAMYIGVGAFVLIAGGLLYYFTKKEN